MNKIIKEPLLHFLLIGAAFFLLYSWVGEESEGNNVIVIDESDLDEIVSKFDLQWKRNPTEEELASIVEKRIEEEIFYQEALKMNLDHNDEIIKRRLAQKMQFLSNDISSVVPPTDEELQAYYSSHSEQYMKEANYSLYQVFFSPDLRNDFRGDASKALPEFQKMSLEKALKLGDEIALPQYFEHTSEFHISRQMGEEFTTEIATLETGMWQGPVSSGYGSHLVYIEAKKEAHSVPFDEVKEKVLSDYNYAHQKEVKASILKEFSKNYEVDFDVKSDYYSPEFVANMQAKILGE